MIKITLLEDDRASAERLIHMLARYQAEHPGTECAVTWISDPFRLLAEYRCDADLLLMDIQMPGMSGMEAAKKLREKDQSVMIVFITSLLQYAIDGYAVNAFDYILKPVRYASFSTKLERVFRVLGRQRSQEALTTSGRAGKQRILLDDILYIEVNNHDILIHTAEAVCKEWGSMKSIEERLGSASFSRCSVHYLVNLKYVQEISNDTVTVHHEKLPISRAKRKEFLSALARYEGGGR